MDKLGNAFVAWLRSNAALVAAVGHTTGDLRIVRDHPAMDRKVPLVAVTFRRPLGVSERTFRTPFTVYCNGEEESDADAIAVIVRDAIAPASPTDAERRTGPDAGDASVRCLSLRLLSPGVAEYDVGGKFWVREVDGMVVWQEV